MGVLFPGFLWALALLVVPLVIHLFYFRRYKPVQFTNVRFLKELVEETASRNKLKNLLILLARLLAVAALIFGFAQPFNKSENKAQGEAHAVSIFVDNSWSMKGRNADGELFQSAKKLAHDILEAYPETDKFQLITHDMDGKQLRLLNREEAFSLLEQIEPTPSVQSLSRILDRQIQTVKSNPKLKPEIYLISDFQKNITQFTNTEIDSSLQIRLVPVQSLKENNLSIDTAYFIHPLILPKQNNRLVYQVSNFGNSNLDDVRVSYRIDQQEFPSAPLQISAGKSKIDTINFAVNQAGWHSLEIKISDFPITYDDQYFMSFQAAEQIKVLTIYQDKLNPSLQSALKSMPTFETDFKKSDALDYSKFETYQLILLQNIKYLSSGLVSELNKACQKGINILLFPAADIGPKDYEAMYVHLGAPQLYSFERIDKEGGEINLESDLFADVFVSKKANMKLPSSRASYSFKGGRPYESLLKYRDETPMLIRYHFEKSEVYIFSSPLEDEYTDLGKTAEIFVPLLFKTALSASDSKVHSHVIGSDNLIAWDVPQQNNIQDLGLKISGPEEFIPGMKIAQNKIYLDVYDQVKSAGIYDLFSGQSQLGKLAFNQNRKESDLSYYSEAELNELYGNKFEIKRYINAADIKTDIKEGMQGSHYWRWLLWAALFFLLAEGIFIRFIKSH